MPKIITVSQVIWQRTSNYENPDDLSRGDIALHEYDLSRWMI